jgi:acetyl-CoA carboxylase biotin carboxyl carrier protein
MSTAEQEVPESVTFREVKELLRTFQDSGWSGMTVELHGMRITVGKHGPPATGDRREWSETRAERAVRSTSDDHGAGRPTRVSGAEDSRALVSDSRGPVSDSRPEVYDSRSSGDAAPDLTGCVAVTSPAVGAFWVAPSPGQPPFVQVGDVVEQDQQLAIVEVMKLMNPVVATVAGTVVHVAAANADLVEFEQPLFWIRP